MNATHLALVALAVACPLGEAQTSPHSETGKADVTVRLEPHDGQTHFRIGDPILIDLVFTGPTGAYTVETDDNPYQSVRDVIDVLPDGGWLRTHPALLGQGLNGNASVKLTSNPVRVPILLNRAIIFQKPGYYEVTVKTERVFTTAWSSNNPSTEECSRCRTTNSLGIDIVESDPSEEAPLVAALSRTLEETTSHGIPEVLTAEEKEEFHHQTEALLNARSSEENKKKLQALMQKMSEAVRNGEAQEQKREQARREAAERLAYLPGDDAARAKVRFIAADLDNGEPDPAGHIMLNGLPSSRNLELQLNLLQQAWRDPQHVPTFVLQSALRQARELVRRGWVTDDQMVYAGSAEDRKTAQEEYQSDLKEVAATLPLRSGENRDRTIDFLKKAGIADQLTQQPTGTQ